MPVSGAIIGRFLPPHRGHEYLINFAQSFVDNLWIFLCSLPSEPIPGSVRVSWMQNMFPRAKIIHIEEINPAANRNQTGAQEIWAQAILQRIDTKPGYIFASEDYGWPLASALGAKFIPVDPSRDQFPISGTDLREHPFRHWHFIPTIVRPWFIYDVILDFPKSPDRLVDILRISAENLGTLYVPKYEEFYKRFVPRNLQESLDPSVIQKAHAAQVEALRCQARHVLLRASNELESCPESRHFRELRLSLTREETAVQEIQNFLHTELSAWY